MDGKGIEYTETDGLGVVGAWGVAGDIRLRTV